MVFNTMRHYNMIEGKAIKEKNSSSIWWNSMKKEFKRIKKLMIRISRKYVLPLVKYFLRISMTESYVMHYNGCFFYALLTYVLELNNNITPFGETWFRMIQIKTHSRFSFKSTRFSKDFSLMNNCFLKVQNLF